jgi:hypothetical protein
VSVTTTKTEGSESDRFPEVLRDAVEAITGAGIAFGVFGGVASAVYGRPRWTKDVDVLCRAEDAEPILDALATRGFEVELTNPAWIYKGMRDDVLVDVIFKAKAEVYFDDAMAGRVRHLPFQGVEVPVIAPEDVIVMKAITTDEATPWHWYDAIGIMAVNDLDWDYLLERARKGPNRVASLLHFAMSIDVAVPTRVLRRLDETIAATWE